MIGWMSEGTRAQSAIVELVTAESPGSSSAHSAADQISCAERSVDGQGDEMLSKRP